MATKTRQHHVTNAPEASTAQRRAAQAAATTVSRGGTWPLVVEARSMTVRRAWLAKFPMRTKAVATFARLVAHHPQIDKSVNRVTRVGLQRQDLVNA